MPIEKLVDLIEYADTELCDCEESVRDGFIAESVRFMVWQDAKENG